MASCTHFKLTDIKSNKYLPKIILDYLNHDKNLSSFYSYPLQIESFQHAIKNRNFNKSKRVLLTKILNQQADSSNTSNETYKNIELLNLDNTYCITTGHQPAIFLGPLYFIYKIVHTIRLCSELKNRFPDLNFVPIYWMATEDHDFEEISSLNLFSKTLLWDPGELKKAAVGELKLDNIDELKASIANTLYKEISNNYIFKQLLECYSSDKTLAQATREAINIIFGKYGLIVLDANDNILKRSFIPIIQNDLLNNTNFNHVTQTSKQLFEKGYKIQIKPQKINFFYLKDTLRSYFIRESQQYEIKDHQLSFSDEELLKLLVTNPEQFSPNVVLRPVYQETILPSLAYVGGVNEISYWLQLKSTFEANKTPFPILVIRNSATIINNRIFSELQKLKLSVLDFINNNNEIEHIFIKKSLQDSLSLQDEKNSINTLFDSLSYKYATGKSLSTLYQVIEAQRKKTIKSLTYVEDKLIKHSKNKFANDLKHLSQIQQAVLPDGTLQERYLSSLFAISQHPDIVEKLYQCFSPLQAEHYIINT